MTDRDRIPDGVPYTAEGFIEQAPWKVAASYADTSPHQYTSRAKAADDAYFTWFAQLILDRGYRAKYGGKHAYKYLESGGWRYWLMWGNAEGAHVINRAPVCQPREPLGGQMTLEENR